MYEIRVAVQGDIDSLYDLISELEDMQIPIDDFKEVFYKNLNDAHIYYYVAVYNQEIIGFISVHIQLLLHHVAKIAEIQEFIVTSKYRSKGIGKMLFSKAKEIAENSKCIQLEVCCNQKRIFLHKFYIQQGMTNNHFKFCLNLNK